MSRTRVKELLSRGAVSVNGRFTTKHDYPLRPGDCVTLGAPQDQHNRLEFVLPVIHEDDAIIAVDKPPGLLSVATATEKLDTAFARLSAQLATQHAGRPYVVHRLDRETSGILLFARSEQTRDVLQCAWENVRKTYYAVVEGRLPKPEGRIENYLVEGKDLRVRLCGAATPGAKRAVTAYREIESRGSFSLVEVELLTGRKHQIRVHMRGLGCPVVGDPLYGNGTNPVGRLGLHATRLELNHPHTGQTLQIEAPLPDCFQQLFGYDGT